MKKNKLIYSPPSIKAEELTKIDVLLSSSLNSENPDNGQKSLLDFESWWD